MSRGDTARPLRAIVLSGGVALGAYQAGVLARLTEAGAPPDWIAATSIGAVGAAIYVGNPPETRLKRLDDFWHAAAFSSALPTVPAIFAPWLKSAHALASAAQTHLVGNPGLFRPRLPPSTPSGGVPAIYDNAPLERLLADFIDFERLNAGEIRFTLMAVDVATGREVVFDTAAGDEIGTRHLLAASGLLPDFAPVEIDGRVLGDGGFSQNAPLHLVVRDEATRDRDLALLVADLFPPDAGLPGTIAAGFEKRIDLLFGCQTRSAIEAAEREQHLRRLLATALRKDAPDDLRREASRRSVAVTHLCYIPDAAEAGSEKIFDFSAGSIRRRIRRGERDAEAALATYGNVDPDRPFTLRRVGSPTIADPAAADFDEARVG